MSNINIESRTFEPQIREVKLGNRKFRLAFPECTVAYDEDQRSLKPLFRLRKNLHVSLPRPIGDAHTPNSLSKDPFDHFWNREFQAISGLPGCCQHYLRFWAGITERDPDAFLKHFDPELYRKSNQCSEIYHLEPQHDHFQRVAEWLVDNQCAQSFEIKTQPPMSRSIQFLMEYGAREILPIYLPELALVFARPMDSLLCLYKIRDNAYIPFLPLPNLWLMGNACLGLGLENHDAVHPFDYFWNSTFTELISIPVHVNPNLAITSTEQWESLVQHDPGFLRKFDPIFSEQYSPVIYKIENNSLSWEFK